MRTSSRPVPGPGVWPAMIDPTALTDQTTMDVGTPKGARLAGGTSTPELTLLNGFELRHAGGPVELPHPSQRLIAFLAVHEQALQRAFVAGSLWPDASDARADGSLRSALWRMHGFEPAIVITVGGRVRLHGSVRVDVVGLTEDADSLAGRSADELLMLARGFEAELLPDWYDDWLVGWRERWRQTRFHALEDVARQLVRAGSFGRAIAVGLAAVSAEPLRESAYRIIIEAHLAEGNVNEAVRQYRSYERVVRDELGIGPSPQITALVAYLMAAIAAPSPVMSTMTGDYDHANVSIRAKSTTDVGR